MMYPPTPCTRLLPSYPSSLACKFLTMPRTYLPLLTLLSLRLDSALRHVLPLSNQPQGTVLSVSLLTSFRRIPQILHL